MKVFVLILAFGAVAILGMPSVVIKNQTVYVDHSPLNLDNLTVIADTTFAKKYLYQTKDTNVTITKLKGGNGISVSAISRGSPEDIAKMEVLQKEIARNITKNALKIEQEVAKRFEDINNEIKTNLQGMFSIMPWF